jgi:hypothetical protein
VLFAFRGIRRAYTKNTREIICSFIVSALDARGTVTSCRGGICTELKSNARRRGEETLALHHESYFLVLMHSPRNNKDSVPKFRRSDICTAK